jgi:hypothetical protein
MPEDHWMTGKLSVDGLHEILEHRIRILALEVALAISFINVLQPQNLLFGEEAHGGCQVTVLR